MTKNVIVRAAGVTAVKAHTICIASDGTSGGVSSCAKTTGAANESASVTRITARMSLSSFVSFHLQVVSVGRDGG